VGASVEQARHGIRRGPEQLHQIAGDDLARDSGRRFAVEHDVEALFWHGWQDSLLKVVVAVGCREVYASATACVVGVAVALA